MRSSPNAGQRPEPDPLAPLGADDDSWIEIVRVAERPRSGGRLGAYEVLEEIRRGGQGLVFRARQPGTGRHVALKRLAAGTFSNALERRRFEREIELACELDHPGIVTVYGVERHGELPLLAMEWVEGVPLDAWARDLPAGEEGLQRKLAAMLSLCDAIAYAHSTGVLHRDLKPSNVLVDRNDRPRVLDFGLARRIEASDQLEATRTLGFVGTPAYAAPECFAEGFATLDVRSDVYSLGVLLYEVLCGRRPFEAAGLRDLLESIEAGRATPPSRLAPGIDRDLDAIVACAMAREPERRYQTVHALGEDLRRYLEGRPVAAVPPRAGYLALKWLRRNRALATVGSAALVLLGGWSTHAWFQAGAIRAERDAAQLAATEAETASAELALALEESRRQEQRARTVRDFYLDAVFLRGGEHTDQGSTRLEDMVADAIELARTRFAEDDDVRLELLSGFARSLTRFGRPEEGRALALEMLELHDSRPEPQWITRAFLNLAVGEASSFLDGPEAAVPWSRAAWADYEHIGEADRNPRTEALLMTARGLADVVVGELEQGLAALERARRTAREATDGLDVEAEAVENLFTILYSRDRRDEARALLDEVLADERFEARSVAGLRRFLLSYRIEFLTEDDDLLAVETANERLVATALELGEDMEMWANQTAGIGRELLRRKEHAAALACFELALELEPSDHVRAQATRGVAQSKMHLGELDDAHAWWERAIEAYWNAYPPANEGRIDALTCQLDLLVATESDEAGPCFDRCVEELESLVASGGVPAGFVIERWFALADMIGRGEEARAAWARINGGR